MGLQEDFMGLQEDATEGAGVASRATVLDLMGPREDATAGAGQCVVSRAMVLDLPATSSLCV